MRVGRFIPDPDRGQIIDICGAIIHAATDQAEAVIGALTDTPGCEVHYVAEDGRLVVTVEATANEPAGRTMEQLSKLPGVLSTSLVFHHYETAISDKECER